jgi:hypothetical protein
MKKIALVMSAFALLAFSGLARAEGDAAAPKTEKTTKKSTKKTTDTATDGAGSTKTETKTEKTAK